MATDRTKRLGAVSRAAEESLLPPVGRPRLSQWIVMERERSAATSNRKGR